MSFIGYYPHLMTEKKYKILKTEIFSEWFNNIENKLQKIIIDRLGRAAIFNRGVMWQN